MLEQGYEEYLEFVSLGSTITNLKKVYFNVIGRFKTIGSLDKLLFNAKKKVEDNPRGLFLVKKFEDIATQVIEKNSDIIAKQLTEEDYSESFNDVKKVFKKVQKGFISSATFYPFFKIYQEFVSVLKGDKEISDMGVNVTNEELLFVAGAIFIYLLGKTIKSIYDIRKEKLEIEEKEKELKNNVKARINKTLDKKLWSQEQMDEWLKERLWSQDDLERMIENKVKEVNNLNEDNMDIKDVNYADYLEFAYADSVVTKAKEFLNKIKNIKVKSPRIIQDVLTNVMSKLPNEQINKILNILSQEETMNEEYYSEGKVLQSIKDMAGELFPSLSFYPALGIWMKIDKVIQGGQGFDILTQGELNLVAIYTAIFVGLVGAKIAKNRIKEAIIEKKMNKEEEFESEPETPENVVSMKDFRKKG